MNNYTLWDVCFIAIGAYQERGYCYWNDDQGVAQILIALFLTYCLLVVFVLSLLKICSI